MIAGIGPGAAVANPGGKPGAAGVPARTASSAAASGITISACGPVVDTGMLAWKTPESASTAGRVAASKPVGSAPVGCWSR